MVGLPYSHMCCWRIGPDVDLLGADAMIYEAGDLVVLGWRYFWGAYLLVDFPRLGSGFEWSM